MGVDSERRPKTAKSGAGVGPRRAVLLAAACLGASSLVSQVLVLRELISVFAGNEIILGVILANWLLATGLGSFLARRSEGWRDPARSAIFLLAWIGLAPVVQIVAIRLLRSWAPGGVFLDLDQAIVGSAVLALPYSLASGVLLALLSGLASKRRTARQIAEVYGLDLAGGVVGGLLMSFVLIHVFAPLETAAMLLLVCLAAAGNLAWSSGHQGLAASSLGLLVLTVGTWYEVQPEWLTARWLFPGQELVEHWTTPYGALSLVRGEGRWTVYENGVPAASTDDRLGAEEMVHYGLSQHPNPKRVLLISGSLAGAPREAAKYALSRIDVVELDPTLFELAERFLARGQDRRINWIQEDARRFLRQARNRYDAILLGTPDPSSIQLNRFYTAEFFREARRSLRPGGILAITLSGLGNYASLEKRELFSSVAGAMEEVFPHLLPIPGHRLSLLASERPLDYGIARRLRRLGIVNSEVRPDFLKASLTDDRIAQSRRAISENVPPNRDFRPVTYAAGMRTWLRRQGSGMELPLLLALGLLLASGLLVARSKSPATAFAISSTGFSSMGLEVVILIAFQILSGSVYERVSLVVTAFLLGAAIGAWANRWALPRADPATARRSRKRLHQHIGHFHRSRLASLDLALLGTTACLALFLGAGPLQPLYDLPEPLLSLLFGGAIAWIGFLGGAEFAEAARHDFSGVERTAGHLHALDLLGAASGALVTGIFAIPALGLAGTCALLAALKLLSVGALWQDRKRSRKKRLVSSSRWIAFAITAGIFGLLGGLILWDSTAGTLYSLSFHPLYTWAVLAILGWGLLRAMGLAKIPEAWLAPQNTDSIFRWLSYLFLAPVIFYPVFRCYFKIPYIFCHVCPRRCVFGFLRPYLVPGALIMNLEKRSWCHGACPIGTFYQCEARVASKTTRRPAWFWPVALGILLWTAVAYFKIAGDLEAQPDVAWDWYTFFYTNGYEASCWILGAAAFLFLAGWRLRRTFCGLLCPVGTLSHLILRLERRFVGRFTGSTQNVPLPPEARDEG